LACFTTEKVIVDEGAGFGAGRLWVLLVVVLTPPVTVAQQDDLDIRLKQSAAYDSSQSLCGPVCVVYALRDRGRKISVEEAARLSGWQSDGTTLQGLQNALKEKAVPTLVRMLYKPKDLAALNMPAILALGAGGRRHYTYVRRVANRNFLVLGFPEIPNWWTLEEVLENFTGEILLIDPPAVYRTNRLAWLSISFLAGIALSLAVFRVARPWLRRQTSLSDVGT
jgi:ABC-type bacteriocin/lantibiotic exporter with double-glycine peptidase domain